MKFSINQSSLLDALNIVSKGISSKSTNPLYSGVFLEAKTDVIILQATDGDLSIQYVVGALIEEDGRTVIPAKLFLDSIKSLDDISLNIETNENQAYIKCESSFFTINTLNPDEFPLFPQVETQQEISIPFDTLCAMVKMVSRSVSKDDSKPVLTGINITLEDAILSMVTTDTFRLALASTSITNATTEKFQAIVPPMFLLDISTLPKSDENVIFALSENQLVVTYKDTVFINRKIEGTYPAYKRIIPNNHATQITLARQDLLSSLRRASLLGHTGTAVKLEVNIDSGVLTLSSVQDSGSFKETLPIEGKGENISIGFNCAYLIEGMQSIDAKKITLMLNSSSDAGVFTTDETYNFLYLVMPMRI